MSPQEALNLLNQVASEFRGSRVDHVRLQEAVSSIQVAIHRLDTLESEQSSAPHGDEPEETKKKNLS